MPSGSSGRPAETLLPIVWRGAMSFDHLPMSIMLDENMDGILSPK